MTSASDSKRCECTVERHRITTIQRIGFYDYGRCERSASVHIEHSCGKSIDVCKQHARMAARGFVSPDGITMPRASRSDYQTGRTTSLPPDIGKWTVPGMEDEADKYADELRTRNLIMRGRR